MANKDNLPLKGFIKDGVIDFKTLAQVQMRNTPEGTDTYKRYEKYWKKVGGYSQNNEVPLRSMRNWDGSRKGTLENRATGVNVTNTGGSQHNNHVCGDDEVWIGIKFMEEETHYKLRDLRGDSIKAEDLENLKEDIARYTAFEMKCWAEFIGKDIQNKEELYDEIAQLLELPLEKVRGARVDSDYDEDKGDVIISFKARITRSVG